MSTTAPALVLNSDAKLTRPPMTSSQASRIESRTSHMASQTARIEAQNEKVSKWVEEIYTGWSQSLQVSSGEKSTAAPEGSWPDSTDALFSIFEEDNPSSSQALCDHARLYAGKEPGEGRASARRLFRCCCDGHSGRKLSSHKHAVEAYVCKINIWHHLEESWWFINMLLIHNSVR